MCGLPDQDLTATVKQNMHRNRMTPFPRSSIFNLCKWPVSLCSVSWKRVMQERKQAVRDRAAQRKHLRAAPLLKPGSCKTTLVPACQAFPKALWASGVQPKDYQAHLPGRVAGITTVTDFKRENPVRRRLEIKAGGYIYILEHASHGTGEFLIQFQTKYSSNRNISWARLNVAPVQPLWEKIHSPPALEN